MLIIIGKNGWYNLDILPTGGHTFFCRKRKYAKKAREHLIVSGDNHKRSYNEPEEMKLALIALGVPESAITLDFAGFRTLDSVVRCKEIFGQNRFTIISQQFHNQRALFIAQHYGINAIAYNAKAITGRANLRTEIREPLARFKAVLDLYVFHKEPKFLGKREYVNI